MDFCAALRRLGDRQHRIKLRGIRALLTLSLLSACAPGWAQPAAAGAVPVLPPAAPVAGVPLSTAPGNADLAARVSEGRRRYTGQCARCHGLNLVTGGIGFDLRQFPRDERARFTHSVRKGLRAMPAFESTASDADIDALWAYIGSVNGW